MGFYYLIHSMGWGKNLSDSTRNSRTFLLGSFLWITAFVILKNLAVYGYISLMYHTLYSSLILLIFADIFVMCYLYKNNYGRSILYEFKDNEKFDYDKDTHTYNKTHINAVITIQRWWRKHLNHANNQHS